MKAIEKRRILVVEDDHLVSEMIKGMLDELGYEIAGEAENGHDALESVRETRPDVVLMDIRMPRMSGIEAAILIQKHFPTPVVILSAYETDDLIEEAAEAGVGAYVVKPPSPAELFRAIENSCVRFEDMLKLRELKIKYDSALLKIEKLSKLVPFCPECGEQKSGEVYQQLLKEYMSNIPPEEVSRYFCSRCQGKIDSV
jgi:AmiR/NasT family two-component response regulator